MEDNIPKDNITHVTKQPDEPPPVEAKKQKTVVPKKQKNPSRVAWGKKLAELAKKHKTEKNVPQHSTNILTWTAIGSLVIALTALYYQMKSTKKTTVKTAVETDETSIFDML